VKGQAGDSGRREAAKGKRGRHLQGDIHGAQSRWNLPYHPLFLRLDFALPAAAEMSRCIFQWVRLLFSTPSPLHFTTHTLGHLLRRQYHKEKTSKKEGKQKGQKKKSFRWKKHRDKA